MYVLFVNLQHAPVAAEAVVEAAKVDGADAKLAQGRGAHDTWLDGDVQVRVGEDGLRVLFEDLGNGHELGMAGSLDRILAGLLNEK
jgi:hypothetical protein